MKGKMLGVLLAGAMLVSLASAEDKSICGEGVCLKLLGQSGKITMAAVDSADKIDSNENKVTVKFHSLSEVDANGLPVGNSDTVPHSTNSLDNQEYVTSPESNINYGDVPFTSFDANSKIIGLSARITIMIVLFRGDGNVSMGNEETFVKKGDIKVVTGIYRWSFCGCTSDSVDEIGAFLDLTTEIQGPDQAYKDNNGDFLLGRNAKMTISSKVAYDSRTLDNMETGYPIYQVEDGKQRFQVRFRKFEARATYESTFNLIDQTGYTIRPDTTTLTTMIPSTTTSVPATTTRGTTTPYARTPGIDIFGTPSTRSPRAGTTAPSTPGGSPRTSAVSVLLLAVALTFSTLW